MSIELLKVMEKKDNYERFIRHVHRHTVEAEVFTILKDMKQWYDKHDNIEWDKFKGWFKMRHPKSSVEQMSIYDRLFDSVGELAYEDDMVQETITHYVKQNFLQRISERALAGQDGDEVSFEEFEQLCTDFYNESGVVSNLEQYEVVDDLEGLIDKSEKGGLEWKLPFLNRSIGSARGGKLIIIAARPNSGKTTLMSQEFMNFATQVEDDHHLLWFNNEEDGVDVRWRHWEGLLEASKERIEASPAKAKEKIEQMIGRMSKVRLIDKPGMSTNDVYSYVKKYDSKIGAIVFDQLWKVRGFEKQSTTDVDRQQKMFSWARELSKQLGCPVITSHQLKGDAEGVLYPDMSMLYGSTTAVQGEADVIIMLGNKNETGMEDVRGISIAKVKGAYGPHVVASERNGKREIILEPEKALFREA